MLLRKGQYGVNSRRNGPHMDYMGHTRSNQLLSTKLTDAMIEADRTPSG